MWPFRKPIDLNAAITRPSQPTDITAVSHLFRAASRRFSATNGNELYSAVEEGRAIVMQLDHELLATAVLGRPIHRVAWLRGFAVSERLQPREAVARVAPSLEILARQQTITQIYYAGDEQSDQWLRPLLEQAGYHHQTDVVVYEKRGWEIPDSGNADVQVRPVRAVDLAEVLQLDMRCFEPQWVKDESILAPAIADGSFFVIAELNGHIAGYSYATNHFGGRLVHLVRIAVDPALRGRGIGVRLLAEFVTYAAEVGAGLLTLNTQAYNHHAQRLYRWFGFTPTGERQPVLCRWL
ncbi:GNAT family N-acetyltransferase [Chloroflexus sp.]|uniref:GNAT family N-acetyltransferase n=2 Tax=Chloroflexus sp. TaxID=1904827 RepID=UPI00298EF8D5|nr:GNAT family N-acetyltransferase [Chloroflexus sp.]MCS6886872.1 GNAT family N-acetyltransferase [Chloroflexus sp.]MDW8403902.1 GNAT family N-acetyltransferase [Chloroflexus sp.]